VYHETLAEIKATTQPLEFAGGVVRQPACSFNFCCVCPEPVLTNRFRMKTHEKAVEKSERREM
jgi:hypothetical protein